MAKSRVSTNFDLRGEFLSLFLAVSVVIVASKGYICLNLDKLCDFHQLILFNGRPLVFALHVLCFCLEDLAVGLCCLVVGMGLLRLTSSFWPSQGVRVFGYAIALLAVLFQLASMKLFKERREFLRLDLFWLGGGFSPYPAVTQSVGRVVITALISIPLGVFVVHALGQWAFRSFWQAAVSRAYRPLPISVTVVGLACLVPLSKPLVGDEWSDFWHNPHLVFVRSLGELPLSFDGRDGVVWPDSVSRRVDYTVPSLSRPPRNLILIVADSISTRYFESYGCRLPTTPNLRRLAPKSLIFDNYYATTNYSFGSGMAIFGGIYGDPLSYSVFDKTPDFPIPSVASHLRSLGYRTYFFGSGGKGIWDYMHTDVHFCTDGFDVSRDPTASFWRESDRPLAFLEPGYDDEAMFDDVGRAVRENDAKPFAFLIWANDTHSPYRDREGPNDWSVEDAPLELHLDQEQKSGYRSYLKAIWRLDRFVGRLYDDLEAMGIAEDTLIAFTGDHGESFGDHGLVSHGNSLFEAQVHVPLILINSRLSTLGKRIETLGGHIDLWATIADLCSLPPHPQWQGRSLVREDSHDRGAYFYSARSGNCGVREGRWKYFWDMRNDKHFLFDLKSDPDELINLADANPSVRDQQNQRVASWVSFQNESVRRTRRPKSAVERIKDRSGEVGNGK